MEPFSDSADELLARWKEEVQRLPVPAQVQLVEGEAGERMARMTRAILQLVERQDDLPRFQPGGDVYAEAGELGRLRRQQGFSIEEVVQENVILRNEFWNLFRKAVDIKRVVDFHLEKRMNACFDLLLQSAAAAYHYDASRQIMENPLRDPVTGLYNKSYFQGRMMEELRRAVRYKHDLTLVLFEIGNYPRLLEQLSREDMERMLKYIASMLSRMTRECDVVARLAEGSFAALLPETGWRGGKVMAERLCRFFLKELPGMVYGEVVPELYWGLASFPEEVQLPDRLYTCAVEAMRAARSLSCDEIAIYRSSGGGGEG